MLFQKRLFAAVLALLFLFGGFSFIPGPAFAAATKVKKKAVKKPTKKKKARSPRRARFPRLVIPLIHKYYLNEGFDQQAGERLIGEMGELGVDSATVDVNSNVLNLKFNTKKLSSITILARLKELGYTVKRIN